LLRDAAGDAAGGETVMRENFQIRKPRLFEIMQSLFLLGYRSLFFVGHSFIEGVQGFMTC
jgi:hypothetical protein